MTRFMTTIALVVALAALGGVSASLAQQPYSSGTKIDSEGDLNLTARQEDLDSYWTDTQTWYWYGYRPYTKVHLSRFTPGMPSYGSAAATATGGYSFGQTDPWGQTAAPWQGGQPQKFQLTKNGTWH
jgi:hypothetical protein